MPAELPRSSAGAAALVELGAEYDVPAARLLAGTGLTVEVLADPTGEISPAAELGLIRNLLAACGDVPGLGLIAGSRYHVGRFGIWGFALLTSPTIRAAMGIAVRFFELSYTFSEIRLGDSADGTSLEFDDSRVPGDVRTFLIERDIASALRIQQDILAEPLPLVRVELAIPEPPDADLYTRALGVRPEFGAERNLVVVPTELLDRALPQANPLVTAATQEQCAALLRTRHERVGVAGQVRQVLLSNPPGAIQQEGAATALRLSSRTLHRRLAEEGTTFRELATETTVLLAQEMLVAGLTVDDVASRVGYGSAPAFTVAFKKATATTPGAWARSMRRRPLTPVDR